MNHSNEEHSFQGDLSSQIVNNSSRPQPIFGYGKGERNDEQPAPQQPTEPVGQQGSPHNTHHQSTPHHQNNNTYRRSNTNGNDNSEPVHVLTEGKMFHLVRAYIKTHHGTRGTDADKRILANLLARLSNDPRRFEIAGLAFFATLDNDVFSGTLQERLRHHVRSEYGTHAGQEHHTTGNLGDLHSFFRSDAYHFNHLPPEISVLDTRTFGDYWLHGHGSSRPYHSYHWYINNLGSLIPDAMSETFQLQGVKCKLRLLKGFTLSNNETWTGLWLHNITRCRDVVNGTFVLVVSNVAYPTDYYAQVITPKGGVRPSQGIGLKLFIEHSNLVHILHKNKHPIMDADGRIRVSVIIH